MTNSAKKPAKTSRDNLDLDLDARLDQATSTLSLDEEPPVGDEIDRVLAKAKKELDANVSPPVAETDDDIDLGDDLDTFLDLEEEPNEGEKIKSVPLKSALATLESQLTAAMESTIESDDDLDSLLGGAGFDFDSLLGDVSDELTVDEAKLHEDSLLAAVDELLNFGAFGDESEIEDPEEIKLVDEIVDVEPEEIQLADEIVDVEPEEIQLADEIVDVEPEEIQLADEIVDVEPEEIQLADEIVDVEPEETVDIEETEIAIKDEVSDFGDVAEFELTVEPEAALNDLVDSVPFEDNLTTAADEPKIDDIITEEFNDFNDVADIAATLVEISTSDESFNDDLDEFKQLDGLNDAMENKNDTAAGFDLLDDAAAGKEHATPVTEALEDDSDWMKQLDGLEPEETSATAEPVKLDKVVDEDDSDWMKQLDGLEPEETSEAAEPVKLDKVADESAEDDLDWMKQLDELETGETSETSEAAEPVKLDKVADESAEDDLDWMKQLDELETGETSEAAEPVKLDKVADESAEDDLDWMKQLDELETGETSEAADQSAGDELDWMKQLDGMDEHDEDTAKMLMDAGHGHDAEEDMVVDHNFNIAENAPKQSTFSGAVDENALIAKAAEFAISQLKEVQEDALDQLKEDQNHALSQLRADQDTIESRTRKQFTDAEKSRKKTATFGYAALGVGIIGLIGSAGIGWFSYDTKNEATALTESVTALDEKVNTFVAKDAEKAKEIASIKTSVDELNQKVEKIAAAQIAPPVVAVAPVVENGKDATKLAGKTTSPVDLLNGKAPVVPAVKTNVTSPLIETPKIAESDIVPPVDIAPAHPAGVTDEHKATETKLSDMVKKTADDAKAKTAKAEADKAAAKAEAELLTQKLAKVSAVAKAASATTKTEEQRKLLADTQASRYGGRMTRGMARGAALTKNQERMIKSARVEGSKSTIKTAAKKEVLNVAVKPQKPAPVGKYSVNVVSYQQEWFAQSKAAEFKQKGIPVEVVPVDANSHSTHFRLKIAGFKNKSEASAYAKAHGISDAWVGSND